MKITSNNPGFTALISFVLLLLPLAGRALAGNVLPESQPVPASAPAASGLPVLNQQKLILKDGRWLVAGGSASWQARSDHPVGADSELYDPRNGQWQPLEGLHFEESQRAYINQLKDGRVLFFVVQGGDTPAYFARTWNPTTNHIENLAVSAKPVPDDGIAVLNDGRVLIVDSVGGSAVIWDARSNTVSSSEVSELENSSWRALPLKNSTVLLLEAFGDAETPGRNKPSQSAALLWNAASGEWKRLGDFPAPFRPDGILQEEDDGAVHAETAGNPFRLAASATEWVTAPAILQAQPPLAIQQPHAVQPHVLPPIAPPQPATQAEVFSERWPSFATKAGMDLLWLLPFVIVWAFWMLASRWLDNQLEYSFRVSFSKVNSVLPALFLLAIVSILLRDGLIQIVAPGLALWWGLHYGDVALFYSSACVMFLVLTPLLRAVIASVLEEGRREAWLRRIKLAAFVAVVSLFLLFFYVLEQYFLDTHGPLTIDFWPEWLDNLKWSVLAVIAPLALYLFVRRQRGDKKAELLKSSRSLLRVFAIVCLTLLVLFAVGSYREGGLPAYAKSCAGQQRWNPVSVDSLRNWAQCVDSSGGIIGSAMFRPTMSMVKSLPSVPCSYVGIWSSTRPGSQYQIRLTDDSRFYGVPVQPASMTAPEQGMWGVVDGKMIWFYDKGMVWPPDINQILPGADPRHFTLVEVNGMRTQFELIQKISSTRCAP